MRDFYHRRQAALLDAQAVGVELMTERSVVYPGTFLDPAPSITATIELHSQPVGEICYGVSPLRDRVYIDDLVINQASKRRGLGQAALWQLWRTHRLPLTPLSQALGSGLFWATVRRRFSAAGATITQDLRNEEQDAEQLRWQNLVPESAMDRSIRRYWEWVEAEHAAGRPAGPGVR
ncbi:hypothetical protein AYO08_10620 [Pseudomonas putida]|nr:hypothetical protein AYO08_10620 [Pseudomonas putida]QNV69548.1 N-acetyltransferase [Pseudomonas sp. CFA]